MFKKWVNKVISRNSWPKLCLYYQFGVFEPLLDRLFWQLCLLLIRNFLDGFFAIRASVKTFARNAPHETFESALKVHEMDSWQKRLLVLAFALISGQSCDGKRIKDGIYTELHEKAFCFRRTNGTHQMGCSSDLNGNVGVVHLVSNENERSWIVEKGVHQPYIGTYWNPPRPT